MMQNLTKEIFQINKMTAVQPFVGIVLLRFTHFTAMRVSLQL
jgi:hypothetical protein